MCDRKFTIDLVDEIMSNYIAATPMRISMIARGKCYICNRTDITPIDICVTYDETSNYNTNLAKRAGWIHCEECSKYVKLYRYYRSPYSLRENTKKYEGIRVRFLRKLERPFTRRYEIGLQRAELGSELMDNCPMSMFTMFNTKMHPWNGLTRMISLPPFGRSNSLNIMNKINSMCFIYAVVNWIPATHGQYGRRADYKLSVEQLNKPHCKLIPLCHLIFINRNLFGYSIEESKIIPGGSPNWIKRIGKEYERANRLTKKWDTLALCLERSGIRPPRVIMDKIFKMWFEGEYMTSSQIGRLVM